MDREELRALVRQLGDGRFGSVAAGDRALRRFDVLLGFSGASSMVLNPRAWFDHTPTVDELVQLLLERRRQAFTA